MYLAMIVVIEEILLMRLHQLTHLGILCLQVFLLNNKSWGLQKCNPLNNGINASVGGSSQKV